MTVVCIPIYKTELEWYEKISLQQALSVFGENYDICFCVPDSICAYYKDKYGNDVIIRAVPDIYLSSIQSYSELCLSPFFYTYFDKYEYMLLYQLDAFVFSDRLNYFCGLGYDYIGADAYDGVNWNLINENVGNGGFSLRKISSCYRMLTEHSNILNEHPFSKMFNTIEDLFWGYCGHNAELDFRIPNIDTANEFAIIYGIKAFLGDDFSKLPMGVHAWNRLDYDVWKLAIEKYGFALPKCDDVEYINTDEIYSIVHKNRELIAKIENRKQGNVGFQNCSIWGAGYYGIKCIRLLNQMGMNIKHVFDWNIHALDGVLDVVAPPIELPTCQNLNQILAEDLLIISTKPDAEIRGKTKNMNYILYEDFINRVEKCFQ